MLLFPIRDLQVVGIDHGDQSLSERRAAPQGFDLNRVLLKDPLRSGAFPAGTMPDLDAVSRHALLNQVTINETVVLEAFASHDDGNAMASSAIPK